MKNPWGIIGGIVVLYLLWRWWQSRSTTASTSTSAPAGSTSAAAYTPPGTFPYVQPGGPATPIPAPPYSSGGSNLGSILPVGPEPVSPIVTGPYTLQPVGPEPGPILSPGSGNLLRVRAVGPAPAHPLAYV